MGQHVRGKLGPAGRVELVRLMLEEQCSERAAAAALSVAPTTAHHWKHRFLAASAEESARWLALAPARRLEVAPPRVGCCWC
jgi:hypothetical protein